MTLYMKYLSGLFIGAAVLAAGIIAAAIVGGFSVASATTVAPARTNVPGVPFYSQFSDIHSAQWQKVGCGIASLAMLIDFYKPGTVSPDTLLAQGIAAGAYDGDAGWSHQGIVRLAEKYGLKGEAYSLSDLSADAAFAQFEKILEDGPAIASVHYKFDPQNPIPHLGVITGVSDGMVYYNDPAAKSGEKSIPANEFIKAWKKMFITVRVS